MMNKTLVSFGIAVLAASSVLAGPPQKSAPKAKAEAVPASITCAVMKDDKVDVKKATADKMYADYKGNRYFFCCSGCPDAFKKDPEKFAKSAHIKTPVAAVAPGKGKGKTSS